MQAMLLAAGLGTRLRPYTCVRPKPLFPVLNKPLLLILLDLLRKNGCNRVVVNSHHLARQIEGAVTGRDNLTLQYEPEILGTGGCLRRALASFSSEPILVMNGDIFHTIDLAEVYQHHITSGNSVTMALHDYPRFNSVRVDRAGNICGFSGKQRQQQEKLLAYTGIQVINPEIIERIPPAQFHHIIDLYETMAANKERIRAFSVSGCYWCDMGTVEDYLDLHRDLLSGTVAGQMMEKKPIKGWLIDTAADVDPSAQLKGWGCIGAGASVGPGVSLENCVVWDHVHLKDKGSYHNTLLSGQVSLS